MTELFQPTGRELAEKGITESHDHAEQVDEGWTLRAIALVADYAKLHAEFMAEDVKPWAYQSGLPEPPVDGAWGSVMRGAAARGIIHRAGKRESKSPGQHGKMMTLWRRGSEMLARKRPTAREANEQADALDRFALQMKNEGRAVFAETLKSAAQLIRDLVA